MGEAEVTFRVCPLPQPLGLVSFLPFLDLAFPFTPTPIFMPTANENDPSDVAAWVAVWGPQWSPCKKTTSFLSGFLLSIQRLSRYFFFYLPL